MKLLFITNIPSPYRVDFFNELGKRCDLTVTFEKRRSEERGDVWDNYKFEYFKGVFLAGKSINTDTAICPSIIKYVKDRTFDHIICANYASPTGMLAIEYMRLHRISYWLEGDGAFAKNDKGLRKIIKSHFITGAEGCFSTADEHDKYYMSYGGKKECLHRYPFTSLKRVDLSSEPSNDAEKKVLKNRLGIKEEQCIVSVGRYSYMEGKGKGFDILVNIAERLDNSIGVYIIGDEPTEEFKEIKINKGEKLSNLHYVDYKKKDVLFQYYRAADLFVLLTRGDAWGLVVNEAMANGLPIVTTTRCIAGTELVKDGVNGYLVEVDDSTEILQKIQNILDDSATRLSMANNSIDLISNYTIEDMAERHMSVLNEALVK